MWPNLGVPEIILFCMVLLITFVVPGLVLYMVVKYAVKQAVRELRREGTVWGGRE